jgi:translation initiation factor 6
MEHKFFLQRDFHGDPNVGLYGFATDKYAIVGVHVEKTLGELKELLQVPVFSTSLLKLDLLRIFITGNSRHILVPGFLPDSDMDSLKDIAKKAGVKLAVINTEHALGNLVLLNDHGCLISPLIRKYKEEIQSVLGIPAEVGQISLLNIVGSLGFATSKGCIVHPAALNSEAEIIEKVLKVKVDTGSVSFGSPYPGAGLLGNSYGFLASKNTAGPELERIAETLGFVEGH